MMKTLLLIGMGPGGPDYLTAQAIAALQRVDCFFLLEKEGRGKAELLQLRQAILDRYRGDGGYRLVSASSPPRRRATADYQAVVEVWHDQKQALFARLLAEELGAGECGALLLWGEPTLYDQTVALATTLADQSQGALAVEIIPGISAVQVLAARHRIPLNRVGEALLITTGRQLQQCDPASIHNAVVMLDHQTSFERFRGQPIDIYWGAYLGCPDETLIAGPLDTVLDELLATRARLRAAKGWIMDTFLLRRRDPGTG